MTKLATIEYSKRRKDLMQQLPQGAVVIIQMEYRKLPTQQTCLQSHQIRSLVVAWSQSLVWL